MEFAVVAYPWKVRQLVKAGDHTRNRIDRNSGAALAKATPELIFGTSEMQGKSC